VTESDAKKIYTEGTESTEVTEAELVELAYAGGASPAPTA